MMSSPKKAAPAKVAGNVTPGKLSSNQQGIPAPYFSGRAELPAVWIGSRPYNPRANEIKTKVGKSKKTTGYDYFCDVVGLLACCRLDYLAEIKVGNNIVWQGDAVRDVTNPDFYDVTVAAVGQFRIYWGTATQPLDNLVLSGTGGSFAIVDGGCGEEHPRYLDQPYLVVKKLYCGDTDTVPTVSVVAERAPRFAGLDEGRSREGANPATTIAEIIADDFFGLGLPSAIHVATWNDLCTVLQRTLVVNIAGFGAHTAKMGYLSPFLDRQAPARDFIAGFLEYFDGWIRPQGDQLAAGCFPHDGATPTGLATLSYHDFISHPLFTSPGLTNVFTDADVIHRDRDAAMQELSTPGITTAARKRLGEFRPQTYSRPAIITSYQAREQANELAKFFARPEETATCTIRRERVTTLRAGDRFILNDAPNAATLIVRITERVDAGAAGELSLSLVAERGLSPLTHVAPSDVSPRLPDPALVAVVNARMFQLPAKFAGEADPAPAVVVLAQRPAEHVAGLNLNFSELDVTYDELAKVDRWSLRGTLAAAITIGATTFTLNASGFDLAILQAMTDAARDDDALLLFVDFEILSIGDVTALGGGAYSLTVLRGRRGSAAASHLINAPCYVLPREDLVIFQHARFPRTTSVRYFKLAAFTLEEEQSLAAALKLTFTFDDTTVDPPGTPSAVGKAEAIYLSWALPTLPDGSPDQTIQMVEIWEKAFGAAVPLSTDPWDIEILGTGINRGGMTAGTQKSYYLRCRDSINTKSAILGPYTATAVAAPTGPIGLTGPVGPAGPTGPGLVYVGTYSAANIYYKTAERTDVVLHAGNYYPAANAAKSGLATWGTPGGADWGAAFTNFAAIATGLLLTQDATIIKTLTMGDGATLAGGIIRSVGATAFGSGAGFWMNPRNASGLTEFRVGPATGGNLSFDGTIVTAGGFILGANQMFGAGSPSPILLTTAGVIACLTFTATTSVSSASFIVGGNAVVGARKAAVTAALTDANESMGGSFTGTDTLDLAGLNTHLSAVDVRLNAHGARINDIIARLKVTGGHGLIAD